MQGPHNWQLKFWHVPHLDNLELLHATHLTHDYPRHMHEEYSIALILQGTETTFCRGASHEASVGDILLIDAEEVHSNKSVGSEYRSIKVRAKLFNRIARDLTRKESGPPHFRQLVVHDALLFRRLLRLHLKLEQNMSALEHESELISTFGLLLARQDRNHAALETRRRVGREDIYVRRIRDFLKSHYAENVSLSQLGTLTNLSPFYLLRVFHNHAGFPPHEYQTQVRIAHARKLIRNGASLSQAALETGFFDQSHLSRNFKRIVGVTPRQYFRGKLHLSN